MWRSRALQNCPRRHGQNLGIDGLAAEFFHLPSPNVHVDRQRPDSQLRYVPEAAPRCMVAMAQPCGSSSAAAVAPGAIRWYFEAFIRPFHHERPCREPHFEADQGPSAAVAGARRGSRTRLSPDIRSRLRHRPGACHAPPVPADIDRKQIEVRRGLAAPLNEDRMLYRHVPPRNALRPLTSRRNVLEVKRTPSNREKKNGNAQSTFGVDGRQRSR